MRTRDDIEAYLTRAALPFRELAEDGTMWLVRDTGWGEHVVVTMAGPLVLFRMKITTLAAVDRHPELFRTLLEMNASDMIHGAYGISDGEVVLTCTLRLENLDYNEFQGTFDDFSMALSNHLDTLHGFAKSNS
ncbi:MAG: YbjN domain-containing protein [Sandaracinaceae bacterium]|jgi:hypothetical protein|nr:YbjN domain-containing protein [Sandaracinaceae bacterium]MBK7155357.1 YbjN domain-containing protein [Sandaracinaceae bacterium]MBK8412306.1 YbjN domain-containing protein [Sandaracinaceae bacterium]MBP7685684.1 YbjN domain-containing protein [Deltaproteobacteria bacterium]